jgi:hypothetical protein
MKTASKRAQRVNSDALEQAAQSGVARAIAARKAAGVELTGTDVSKVSGGFGTFLINGGELASLVNQQPQANVSVSAIQTLGSAQGLAGAQGLGAAAGAVGAQTTVG